VTFTVKAASELVARLGALLGGDVAADLWVGTFHSVCVRLLRRYHAAAGLSSSFVVYDEGDQRVAAARALKLVAPGDRSLSARQLLARVSAAKQEGRGPGDVGDADPLFRATFEAYERQLSAANAVDFDDLLVRVVRLVEDPEGQAGREIAARFRHVLVDEFQDVNQIQYRLVRALTASTRNLCVVGDDDQSIYHWRGADVRIVRHFRDDFPDAEVVKLEQNYRSSGHVVRGALEVIRGAREREPKELWTANAPGVPIRVGACADERAEAAFVVARVRRALDHGLRPGDLAVFYRTHAQSLVLEEAMLRARVPYEVVGGLRFFERAEVKDALAYLRLGSNPTSDVDALRVINVPPRRIGPGTVERIELAAAEWRLPVLAALPQVSQALGTAAKHAVLGFHELMERVQVAARERRPSDALDFALEASGYRAMLAADDSPQGEARRDNLRELAASVAAYEADVARLAAEGKTGAIAAQASLTDYLERVSLGEGTSHASDAPGGRVALMTVHVAKGLEFEAVFLTGMEEDLFPYQSETRESDLEEERRLAYVAITRARRVLWVTYARTRHLYGRTRPGVPSRFITDLPRASVRFGDVHGPEWVARAVEVARPVSPRTDVSHVQRDARVEHPTFGVGLVLAVDGLPDPTATVVFGQRVRTIKARFLLPLPEVDRSS
jgi:DNA helicase-2/ATP-dependent DNA helicase PcrA